MSRRVRLLNALLRHHQAQHSGFIPDSTIQVMTGISNKIRTYKQKENAKRRTETHATGKPRQFEIEGMEAERFNPDYVYRAGAS